MGKKEIDKLKNYSDEEKNKILQRIEVIKEWAVENNMMKSMSERIYTKNNS